MTTNDSRNIKQKSLIVNFCKEKTVMFFRLGNSFEKKGVEEKPDFGKCIITNFKADSTFIPSYLQ